MPRSHHNPGVFFRKMKKKPALQAIIDNLDSYTEDQLKVIQGQPLWIREQLVKLKQNNGEFSRTPEEIADAMQAASLAVKVVEDEYEVRVMDIDVWVNTGPHTMTTLVPAGDAILVVDQTKIMHGYTDTRVDANSYQQLVTGSKTQGDFTRSEYKQIYQRMVSQKHV